MPGRRCPHIDIPPELSLEESIDFMYERGATSYAISKQLSISYRQVLKRVDRAAYDRREERNRLQKVRGTMPFDRFVRAST